MKAEGHSLKLVETKRYRECAPLLFFGCQRYLPIIFHKVDIYLAAPGLPTNSFTLGIGYAINFDIVFAVRKSMQNQVDLSGFNTSTMGLLRSVWNSSTTAKSNMAYSSLQTVSHIFCGRDCRHAQIFFPGSCDGRPNGCILAAPKILRGRLPTVVFVQAGVLLP